MANYKEHAFSVNEQIQNSAYDLDKIKEGVIVEVVEPTICVSAHSKEWFKLNSEDRNKTTLQYKVKWSDDTTEVVSKFSIYPKDTSLEREFRQHFHEVQVNINLKLEEALHALKQAVAISEQEGVPFYSNLSFSRQPYCPTTIKQKYPSIEAKKVEQITAIYMEESFSTGWQHSTTC